MLSLAVQTSFYEAAAQVLPVFLLVMTIGEARLQKRIKGDRKEDLKLVIVLTLALVLGVVAGEVASFRVLMRGRDGEVERAFAIGGIATGLGYVVMWVVRSTFDEYREDFSLKAQRRQIRLQLFITVLAAAFVFLGIYFSFE